MSRLHQKESSVFTWIIVALLVLFIIIKGYFALFVVADSGQPAWDYRPVKDIPGESPYAIYQSLPYSQHIKGEKGE